MARFAHHARRVRVLKHIQPTREKTLIGKRIWHVRPTISESCFGYLHDYFQDIPALPVLHELTCDHDDFELAEYLGLFFSLVLRVLSFSRSDSHYSACRVFDELTKRGCADALEVLRLDEASRPADLWDEPDDLGMAFLARLPRLRKLTLPLILKADYRTILQQMSPGSFPALRELKILCVRTGAKEPSDGDAALGAITDLLNYLAPTHPLRVLGLEVPEKLENGATRKGIRALFEAVGAFANTLDTLSIWLGIFQRKDEPPLDRSIFAPLTDIPVHELVMERIAFDIDLPDLEAIRDTWPALRYLYLGQRGVGSSYRIPVTALPGFVSGLRNLEKLGLTVYDSGEDLDLKKTRKRAQWRIRGLDVGYSRFLRGRAAEVATYLARSFSCATPTIFDGFPYTSDIAWQKAVEEEQSRQRRGVRPV